MVSPGGYKSVFQERSTEPNFSKFTTLVVDANFKDWTTNWHALIAAYHSWIDSNAKLWCQKAKSKCIFQDRANQALAYTSASYQCSKNQLDWTVFIFRQFELQNATCKYECKISRTRTTECHDPYRVANLQSRNIFLMKITTFLFFTSWWCSIPARHLLVISAWNLLLIKQDISDPVSLSSLPDSAASCEHDRDKTQLFSRDCYSCSWTF